jgi:5-methylcytosine-specific restriction endonuclease McrA
LNALIQLCAYNARKRNLEFALSRQQFLTLVTTDCHYCGEPPHAVKKRTYIGTFAVNGIDRVDNAHGYVVGNVVSCCPQCNKAKGTLSADEFKAWASRVYTHSKAAR